MVFANAGKTNKWPIIRAVVLNHVCQLHPALLGQRPNGFGSCAGDCRTAKHLHLEQFGGYRFAREGVHEPDGGRPQIVIRKIQHDGSDDRRRSRLSRRENHEDFRKLCVKQDPAPLAIGRFHAPIVGKLSLELYARDLGIDSLEVSHRPRQP
ncbi:hypothetical protein CQ10_35610 [Bradyrhizobium valentinum]|nr:hypothetical protein CQ10_35610 [Bradyrhizobium valentinum]